MNSFLLSIGAFVSAVLSDALVSRLLVGLTFASRFLIVATILAVCLCSALFISAPVVDNRTISAVALYAFLCELYLLTISLVSNSVSVTLMIRCAKNGRKPMPLDIACDSGQMVQQRVVALMQTGFLTEHERVYVVTEKGRTLLAIVDGFRRVFRHQPSNSHGAAPPSDRLVSFQ